MGQMLDSWPFSSRDRCVFGDRRSAGAPARRAWLQPGVSVAPWARRRWSRLARSWPPSTQSGVRGLARRPDLTVGCRSRRSSKIRETGRQHGRRTTQDSVPTACFHELPLSGELDEVRLNVEALVVLELTPALEVMVPRRSGSLLNVASTASFQPGPKNATYAATKAFVRSFTEALHEEVLDIECARDGSLPWFHTDRLHGAGGPRGRGVMPGFMWRRRCPVAVAGLEALERNDAGVHPGPHEQGGRCRSAIRTPVCRPQDRRVRSCGTSSQPAPVQLSRRCPGSRRRRRLRRARRSRRPSPARGSASTNSTAWASCTRRCAPGSAR